MLILLQASCWKAIVISLFSNVLGAVLSIATAFISTTILGISEEKGTLSWFAAPYFSALTLCISCHINHFDGVTFYQEPFFRHRILRNKVLQFFNSEIIKFLHFLINDKLTIYKRLLFL